MTVQDIRNFPKKAFSENTTYSGEMLHGCKVYTNDSLVDSVTEQVDRTWKERLFSRPWKPLIRTKYVQRSEPSRQIYQLPNGSFVMHPVMLRELMNHTLGLDKNKEEAKLTHGNRKP